MFIYLDLGQTETALLKVVNDSRTNFDKDKPSDTAFDTVAHQILLNRLIEYVGLSGSVLNWFTSKIIF